MRARPVEVKFRRSLPKLFTRTLGFPAPIHRVASPPAGFQKLVGLLTDSLESDYSKVGGKTEAPESSLSFSGALSRRLIVPRATRKREPSHAWT